MSEQDNPLKDVPNILGFLLAGFAGILGFIGLSSAEVTTVLRNEGKAATLIALVLLLAVLAAVLGVTLPSSTKVSWLRIVGIFLLIVGLASFVIDATPITTPNPNRTIEVWLARYCLGAGLLLLVISFFVLKNGEPNARIVSILVSVTLIAVSVYGAMRLETQSQLNSSVEVSATLESGSPRAAMSVHVTASKMKDVGYIGIVVRGLPAGLHFIDECKSKRVRSEIRLAGKFPIQCSRAPCLYLIKECRVIFDGSVPPGPTGNIDDVITDPITVGRYQDISILASKCTEGQGCSNGGSGSRFDLHLANQPISTSP